MLCCSVAVGRCILNVRQGGVDAPRCCLIWCGLHLLLLLGVLEKVIQVLHGDCRILDKRLWSQLLGWTLIDHRALAVCRVEISLMNLRRLSDKHPATIGIVRMHDSWYKSIGDGLLLSEYRRIGWKEHYRRLLVLRIIWLMRIISCSSIIENLEMVWCPGEDLWLSYLVRILFLILCRRFTRP